MKKEKVDYRNTIRNYPSHPSHLPDWCLPPLSADATPVFGATPVFEAAGPPAIDEPAVVEVLATNDGADAACARCCSTEFTDTTIHDGATIRRDCANCGFFYGWPKWHGAEEPIEPPPRSRSHFLNAPLHFIRTV